jgi:hypothetical protein
MKKRRKTVERSEMQQWHKGPRTETAAMRQNENKVPMWQTAAIFEEGEDNHEWHWRLELRTPVISVKRRNTQDDPVCHFQTENQETSCQKF